MISYPQSLEQRHLVNFQLTGEAWYNRNYKTLSLKKKVLRDTTQPFQFLNPLRELNTPRGGAGTPDQSNQNLLRWAHSSAFFKVQQESTSLRTTLQEKDS